MKKEILLIIGCASLIAGCSEKAPAPVASVAAPAPAPQLAPDMNAAGEVPPPPIPGAVTSETAPVAAAPEAVEEVVMHELDQDLHKLTVILQSFRGEQGRMPNSIDELVSKGFLPRLPTPPAGKKLTIDVKSEKIVLVNL